MVTIPVLTVVSGPPGSGMTMLAHEVARVLGCPAVCRDVIKQGMAHADPAYEPRLDDPVNRRALTAFFDVLAVLLVGLGASRLEPRSRDRRKTGC